MVAFHVLHNISSFPTALKNFSPCLESLSIYNVCHHLFVIIYFNHSCMAPSLRICYNIFTPKFDYKDQIFLFDVPLILNGINYLSQKPPSGKIKTYLFDMNNLKAMKPVLKNGWPCVIGAINSSY